MIPLAGKPRLLKLDLLRDHQRYFAKDGEQLPGVSTIKNLLGKGENLYRWYHGLGAQGVVWEDIRTYMGTDLGTVTHGRAEAFLRGYEGLDPASVPLDLYAASGPPYERFLDRWMKRGLRVVESECQLVSEELRVGGTLDILAHDPVTEDFVLVDLKTSNPYVRWEGKKRWTDLDLDDRSAPQAIPYPDVIVQVAGYRRLWNENHPDRPIQGVEVWRIGKSADDPGQVHFLADKMEDADAAFVDCCHLHYRLKRLERNA